MLKKKIGQKQYVCVFCRSTRLLPCDVVAEPETSTLQVENTKISAISLTQKFLYSIRYKINFILALFINSILYYNWYLKKISSSLHSCFLDWRSSALVTRLLNIVKNKINIVFFMSCIMFIVEKKKNENFLFASHIFYSFS